MAMVGDNVGNKKWMVMINREGAGNNQEMAQVLGKGLEQVMVCVLEIAAGKRGKQLRGGRGGRW